MLDNIISGLIGAGIIQAVQYVTKRVKRNREAKLFRMRDGLSSPTNISQAIIEYHENAKTTDDLLSVSDGKNEHLIPFITRKEWWFEQEVRKQGEDRIINSREVTTNYRYKHRTIKKLEKLMGKEVLDEMSYYYDGVEYVSGLIKVRVKSCSYLPIASKIQNLQEETLNAIVKNNRSYAERDKGLRDSDTALFSDRKPVPVGCAAVLALKDGKQWLTILHKRSNSVITTRSTLAVIPTFGLVPFLLQGGEGNGSELYANFVREYMEELFNVKGLSPWDSRRASNPAWFFGQEEAEKLEKSKFSLFNLGFGFNCFHGGLVFALLAKIEDKQIIEHIINQVKRSNQDGELCNEEVQLGTLQLRRLGGKRIEEIIKSKDTNPASVFALVRAQEYLRR